MTTETDAARNMYERLQDEVGGAVVQEWQESFGQRATKSKEELIRDLVNRAYPNNSLQSEEISDYGDGGEVTTPQNPNSVSVQITSPSFEQEDAYRFVATFEGPRDRILRQLTVYMHSFDALSNGKEETTSIFVDTSTQREEYVRVELKICGTAMGIAGILESLVDHPLF